MNKMAITIGMVLLVLGIFSTSITNTTARIKEDMYKETEVKLFHSLCAELPTYMTDAQGTVTVELKNQPKLIAKDGVLSIGKILVPDTEPNTMKYSDDFPLENIPITDNLYTPYLYKDIQLEFSSSSGNVKFSQKHGTPVDILLTRDSLELVGRDYGA